ncbi:MAG: serine/threonine protein kinase, partial [Anaerolineae bacterium]
MALTPGLILLDKYRIVEPLGHGAWGDVYLAEDLQLGRQVAIKHLKADWTGDETVLQRFLREARVIAALQHPNVVVIHALEQDGAEHYIVEEYAERGTVGDLLAERGQLPVDLVLDIAIAICRALGAVHRQGIIHRDIKPTNILLSESPEGDLIPKLCDFGIAHVPTGGEKRPLTSDGDMLGTVQYMSPEQIQGEKADERSDLYSLGAVLYEMLTGRKVFTGSPWSVLQAHVGQEPPPPARERPEIAPPLNDLVLRALAKDPAARYQKARDMRQALEWIKRQEVEKREKVASLYAQGVAHLHAGEWGQAIESLSNLLSLAP